MVSGCTSKHTMFVCQCDLIHGSISLHSLSIVVHCMRRQLLVHPTHRKRVPTQLPPWCSFYRNGWVVVAVHGHQQRFLAPFPCLKQGGVGGTIGTTSATTTNETAIATGIIDWSDHFINNQPNENINTCPYIFYISQFMPQWYQCIA